MNTLPPVTLSRKDLIMIELLKGQTADPLSIGLTALHDPVANASKIADGIIANGAHPFAGRSYSETGSAQAYSIDSDSRITGSSIT